MMKSTTDFDKNGGEATLPESIRYRLDVVFAAAALTVLAGLLIPLPTGILDMAWVVAVCLAAAVVIICILAKSCHDLQGFGFLVGALMLLRICLTAMTVRKILVEHTSSIVLDILGKSVAGIGAIGGAVIALLLAIVGFGSILPAANQIRRSAQRYAGEILSIKRAALQAELSLKKIPREQARDILEKIRTEMRFFGSMGAVAVLMRCEAAAGVVMIAVSLTLKAITDAMAGGYNPEFLNILAGNATGLVIVAVVPSVAANWSCAVLSRKDSLCLKTSQATAEKGTNSRKIQLVGATADNPKQVELLNPDFMDKAQAVGTVDEKIVEFEPDRSQIVEEVEYAVQDMTCENARQYYQKLTDMLLSIKKEKEQAILLTSPADTPLSIAVAVNAAICMASTGKKVLLIDAEPGRNAAARAFELDIKKAISKPQTTCIEGLSVFTAGQTETQIGQRIGLALDKLSGRFDYILVYGPQQMQLLATKTPERFCAIVFAKSSKNTTSVRLDAVSQKFASTIALSIPPAS